MLPLTKANSKHAPAVIPSTTALKKEIVRLREEIQNVRYYNYCFIHPPINGQTLRIQSEQETQVWYSQNPLKPSEISQDEVTRLRRLYKKVMNKSVKCNELYFEDMKELQRQQERSISRSSCSCSTKTICLVIAAVAFLFRNTLRGFF